MQKIMRSMKFNGERYTAGKQQNWAISEQLCFRMKKKKTDHKTSLWKSVNTGRSGRLFCTMVADYKTDLV